MTDVRRLVNAVLVPGFTGASAPAWVRRAAEEGLGGVCWFGQNVTDQQQARRLSDELHGARSELLVLSDEEGGDVTRLEASTGSSWPGHAALGRLDDEAATRTVAAGIGSTLRAAGIDVALAPVVDVNADPDNPVIGVRSFGADPRLVARHGAAFVAGLQSAGVAACAKHFPGHGSTVTDSHVALPRVDDSEELLRERDLAPFAAAVEAGARCVMTAHVVFPAFDDAPATLSQTLLRLLRADFGFDGVIVSDALDMHAISRGVGRVEGAVRAINAGVDLVCIGNPVFPESYDEEQVFEEVAAGLARAVEGRRLDLERLEEAAARVSELARWVRAPGADPSLSAVADGGDEPAGVRIARRSVHVRGDVVLAADPVVAVLEGAGNRAAGRSPNRLVAALADRFPATDVVATGTLADASAAVGKAVGRPLLVLVGEHPDEPTLRCRNALLAARPDAIVVYTGVARPDDSGDRTVHTYGGGRATAQALAELLAGASA